MKQINQLYGKAKQNFLTKYKQITQIAIPPSAYKSQDPFKQQPLLFSNNTGADSPGL